MRFNECLFFTSFRDLQHLRTFATLHCICIHLRTFTHLVFYAVGPRRSRRASRRRRRRASAAAPARRWRAPRPRGRRPSRGSAPRGNFFCPRSGEGIPRRTQMEKKWGTKYQENTNSHGAGMLPDGGNAARCFQNERLGELGHNSQVNLCHFLCSVLLLLRGDIGKVDQNELYKRDWRQAEAGSPRSRSYPSPLRLEVKQPIVSAENFPKTGTTKEKTEHGS